MSGESTGGDGGAAWWASGVEGLGYSAAAAATESEEAADVSSSSGAVNSGGDLLA